MISAVIPTLRDTALYRLLQDLLRRAVDGTVAPLFVDYTNQRIGVRTTTPAASAAFEIAGTTGALLLPRLTTTQRDALTAVNGMVIYNTTTTTIQGYVAGAWANL